MSGRLVDALNRNLDRLVRTEVHVLHRSWSAFQVCGYTGLALAILLTMSLVMHLGLSPIVMAGVIITAVLTFLGLVMATKMITGQEKIIYYHHEIAVMGMVAFLLWLLHQPVLPYLEMILLGIGLFLALGRVGCLMVGCCHGRPHRWGVCYREEHAAAGFTPYYVSVRLFPVQAVESLWVGCVVLVGSGIVWSGHPPGTALAWYVITYDLGRFCFEFVRGDPERPYFWGFSQPQWISILLMCLVTQAELSGNLPFYAWHAGVTVCLLLAMIAIASRRRFLKSVKYELLHPHHVKEFAEAVEMVSSQAIEGLSLYSRTADQRQTSMPAEDIPLGCTSLGIQISAGKIKSATGLIRHYAISSRNGGMSEEAVEVLSRLILQLEQKTAGPSEVLKGKGGVFHLLIHPLPGKEWAHG